MTARIFAYPARSTLFAGEALDLRVRAGSEPLDVQLARCGDTSQRVFARPAAFAEASSDWHGYTIPLPERVRHGAYVARVVRRDAACEPLLDARDGAAFFVVRPVRRARVLVNVPLFTYHAYSVGALDPDSDDVTGASLYTDGKRVSLARPGGGTGGRIWDERNVDVYDRASPRQTWAHWDAKAIAWLEREGIAHDVCTDLDIHQDDAIFDDRRLLLCFGHHEYWTDTMRGRVERFVADGGNVAFFGANSLWFRTDYDAATHTIGRTGAWPVPESALTGVSYGRGGGWWCGERPAGGLTVRNAAHWLFAKTGLRDGDTFGADARLVGYECDGLGEPGIVRRTTLELASANLSSLWIDPDDKGQLFANGRASLAISNDCGTVVSAGTVDWPRLLGRDPVVTQITRNVISHLGGNDAPEGPPVPE